MSGKSKGKVYCSECKFYKTNEHLEGGIDGYSSTVTYEECEHPNNVEDTYLKPAARKKSIPSHKNHANNCRDFEAK